MTREGYGEASRELFVQFLFRISKEFAGKPAHLCLFSKLKYLNSNNDQKIRDGFFQYAYCRGFIFPIKCFHGSKGNFPVGFLVWNLTQKIHLSKQAITLDVFNAGLEKVGTKTVPCVSRTEMLNKWCPRPKWDGHSVMPMFTSALNQQLENKDQRDHIAEGYLFSVVSKGDDFQNTNACFILSTPYANAGAFSVTAENFERAMILHAVKKIPVATWTNDRDAFYAPKSALGGEFISDCVVWSAFAPSNYTVSLKDVSYKGTTYQIRNNLYPFPFGEVRAWGCPLSDIAAQFAGRDEDRYLARWLKGRTLSSEARAVLDAAQLLYRCFYSEILNTNWVDYRVSPFADKWLHTTNAVAAAQVADILPRILADGIPATTFAAGANETGGVSDNVSFHGLMSNEAVWPKGRQEDVEGGGKRNVWQHSDIKNLAYFYVYRLFELIVESD